MKKNTYKTKALKLFAGFLAAMAIMSIVSRGVYASQIPKVTTIPITHQSLSYKIECSGSLETSKKMPIYVIPDLRIGEIYPAEGDFIEAGNKLLRYDKKYLEDCIKKLENEIETDRLTRLDHANAQAWNSIKILDISTNEKNERLAEYRTLLENNGEIMCETTGVITDIKINPGGFTDESAAFFIANSNADLCFCADITEEDTEHISVGDLVTLKFRNGKITIPSCEISAILKKDTDGVFQLKINMEPSELKIGETGKIEIVQLSEEKYDLIPIEAVYSEGVSKYVYVIEESEGFLGTEYHAVKKTITFAGQNDKYIAAENSGFNIDDIIVISSNKDLFDGDVVRMKTA